MNFSYLKDYSIQMEDRRVSVGLGSSSTSIPVNSLSIDNIGPLGMDPIDTTKKTRVTNYLYSILLNIPPMPLSNPA